MTKVTRAAYWLTPIAFCIVLYWYGLKVWFLRDDFAWLGLQDFTTTVGSLLRYLFVPLAQGTIRPWSERAFFLVFSSLFGLHALPFRLFVFLNQSINLILLTMLARKWTGSALAGVAAPLLWLSNVALVTPMAWSAAYNEIQFTTFFLASLYLFVRYTESCQRKYYAGQWITFLLAFGSLELNVVYPAVVAAYSLIFSRKHFRSTLPMFAVSILYFVIHRLAAGPTESYYYQTIFGPSILTAFGKYWVMILDATNASVVGLSSTQANILLGLMTAAILGFVIRQTWKRAFLPLFFLLCYFITLTPFLLISRHIVSYYQTIPAIALAMLAADALAVAWRSAWGWKIATATLVTAYAVLSIADVRQQTRYYYDASQRVRHLLEGVAYAEKLHPGKTILLKDMDDQLFWDCMLDVPFRLLGDTKVLVAPETRTQIHEDPNLESMDQLFLPVPAIVYLLKHEQLEVYATDRSRLRNVTHDYAEVVLARNSDQLSTRIDLTVSFFDGQLGEGWYQPEKGFRWMGRHAVLYLPGPTKPGEKLYLHGVRSDQQRWEGPLHLTVTIDGQNQAVNSLDADEREFQLAYDLRPELVGRAKVEIGLTVDKAFHSGRDSRELGLLLQEADLR
jgi:hypothetical protein